MCGAVVCKRLHARKHDPGAITPRLGPLLEVIMQHSLIKHTRISEQTHRITSVQ